MITLQAISDSLKAMLEELETGVTVYQHNRPDGFVRPSYLVHLGKVDVTALNGRYIDLRLEVTLTGFEDVDVYHQSQFDALIQRMAQVMALFYDGYFRVEDRNPHVEAISANHGLDYFEIKLAVEWSEELETDSGLPLIGEVITRIEEKGGQ